MSGLQHAREIEDYGDRAHPPVPHACPDPETHTGLFRMVGPYEWDEMWNVDENGWPYSSGRGTRVVDPETGAVTTRVYGSEWPGRP